MCPSSYRLTPKFGSVIRRTEVGRRSDEIVGVLIYLAPVDTSHRDLPLVSRWSDTVRRVCPCNGRHRVNRESRRGTFVSVVIRIKTTIDSEGTDIRHSTTVLFTNVSRSRLVTSLSLPVLSQVGNLRFTGEDGGCLFETVKDRHTGTRSMRWRD